MIWLLRKNYIFIFWMLSLADDPPRSLPWLPMAGWGDEQSGDKLQRNFYAPYAVGCKSSLNSPIQAVSYHAPAGDTEELGVLCVPGCIPWSQVMPVGTTRCSFLVCCVEHPPFPKMAQQWFCLFRKPWLRRTGQTTFRWVWISLSLLSQGCLLGVYFKMF